MHQILSRDYKKDFLYHGLPAIWHANQYLVFSPYAGKIAVLTVDELSREKTQNWLEKLHFFGQPHTARNNPEVIRLVLMTTSDCRLRCKYCYEHGGETCKIMDFTTAKTAIEFAYQAKKSTAKAIDILFFGGEPTLNFDLIQNVVALVKKLPLKHKYFSINTDGLLNFKQLDWMIKEKFFIQISCDGPSIVQNKLRPLKNGSSSSQLVEKNIKYLITKKSLFGIRATITSDNIKLTSLVNYFSSLGVKFLHFERVLVSGRAKCSLQSNDSQYVKEFAQAIKLAAKKKVYLITSPLMNLFSPADYFCVQIGEGKFIVNTEGEMHLCYLDEVKDYAKVGEIKNSKVIFNYQQLRKISQLELSGDCQNCAYKFICSGSCPADNFLATGTFSHINSKICAVNQQILHLSIVFLYQQCLDGFKNKFFPILGKEILEREVFKYNKF
ncbi:MAG: radical SAM protein [Patescibacteria group bacterium]